MEKKYGLCFSSVEKKDNNQVFYKGYGRFADICRLAKV